MSPLHWQHIMKVSNLQLVLHFLSLWLYTLSLMLLEDTWIQIFSPEKVEKLWSKGIRLHGWDPETMPHLTLVAWIGRRPTEPTRTQTTLGFDINCQPGFGGYAGRHRQLGANYMQWSPFKINTLQKWSLSDRGEREREDCAVQKQRDLINPLELLCIVCTVGYYVYKFTSCRTAWNEIHRLFAKLVSIWTVPESVQ